jgi:hypothetical protein
MLTTDQYFAKYYPQLLLIHGGSRQKAVSALAQTYNETGGMKPTATIVKANNPGAIVWTPSFKGDFMEAGTGLKFRVYDSMFDGFRGHKDLLERVYPKAYNAGNYIDFADTIAESAYIVDSDGRENYAKNIKKYGAIFDQDASEYNTKVLIISFSVLVSLGAFLYISSQNS